jgi:hypothetical protein
VFACSRKETISSAFSSWVFIDGDGIFRLAAFTAPRNETPPPPCRRLKGYFGGISSAGDGNRTRTRLSPQGILSPLRLPVPPPRRRKGGRSQLYPSRGIFSIAESSGRRPLDSRLFNRSLICDFHVSRRRDLRRSPPLSPPHPAEAARGGASSLRSGDRPMPRKEQRKGQRRIASLLICIRTALLCSACSRRSGRSGRAWISPGDSPSAPATRPSSARLRRTSAR